LSFGRPPSSRSRQSISLHQAGHQSGANLNSNIFGYMCHNAFQTRFSKPSPELSSSWSERLSCAPKPHKQIQAGSLLWSGNSVLRASQQLHLEYLMCKCRGMGRSPDNIPRFSLKILQNFHFFRAPWISKKGVGGYRCPRRAQNSGTFGPV